MGMQKYKMPIENVISIKFERLLQIGLQKSSKQILIIIRKDRSVDGMTRIKGLCFLLQSVFIEIKKDLLGDISLLNKFVIFFPGLAFIVGGLRQRSIMLCQLVAAVKQSCQTSFPRVAHAMREKALVLYWSGEQPKRVVIGGCL